MPIEPTKPVSRDPHLRPSDVAILGMAFRFPGDLRDREALCDLLYSGRTALGPLPEERAELLGDLCDLPESAGGYVAGIEYFDAPFFNMNGREARITDPQQRILLETAWHALEDAALPPEALDRGATAVAVGAHACDYHQLALQSGIPVDAYWNAGVNMSLLANRLSFFFDLHGPSLTVNTACSSSLEALVLATSLIENGSCNTAIVGGVNLMLTSETSLSARRGGLISPTGECRPFDDRANGFVRGEGVVVLVLGSLTKALEERRPIHAVIRSAVSGHGGRAASLVSPQLDRQRDLLVTAHRRAGLSDQFVNIIEAHGTGTRLGDAVEVEAIHAAIELIEPESQRPVSIGSVKGNIGHMESAAGLAGVVRVCVGMQRGQLPPSGSLEEVSSLIRPSRGTVIQRACEPWLERDGVRRGGISSFGFGGSIAHVILESPPARPLPERGSSEPAASGSLVRVTARSRERLEVLVRRLHEWLSKPTSRGISLPEIARTLRDGRTRHPVQVAWTVATREELIQEFDRFLLEGEHSMDTEQRSGALLGGEQPCAMTSEVPSYPFARHRYWLDPGSPTAND